MRCRRKVSWTILAIKRKTEGENEKSQLSFLALKNWNLDSTEERSSPFEKEIDRCLVPTGGGDVAVEHPRSWDIQTW